MKQILISIRMIVWLSLLTGLLYPLLMTEFGQLVFPDAAAGSLAQLGDQPVGTYLLAQKFTQNKYFWPRPSGVDYNTQGSGGSNLGLTSADLLKAVTERRAALVKANPNAGEPPQDLLYASGSGLDPHISPLAAYYQVSRVAQARHLSADAVMQIVDKLIEDRQLGFLGELRVNVLALNLALDKVGTSP